jgi:ketosteroid isomerase-like protein
MPNFETETQMRWIMLVTVFLTAFVAPALAQKAQIDVQNAKWIDSFNKGDFDGLAQLYTVDAIAFPPGSPMVKGRPALSKLWKTMAEQAGSPKLTTLNVKRLGPSAIREIGTYSLMTKGPSPKEMSGKYLVVWERVRGDWKLASDIWNDGR